MSYGAQLGWLSSYNRETGSLSTHAAKDCGYGDMLKSGYVVNRGTDEMPDLFITKTGMDVVAIYSQPIRREGIVKTTDPSPVLKAEIAAAADNARAKAEIAIEKILQGLEHDTMLKIDMVKVDTRNFANLNVEIFFRS